ncbi:MAG: aldehyde dehydrogenase family protein [Acidobacteria bacterium]|nr:aldehyde dehydrogenase family protein [Acidobacteriota bacterium]
MLQDLDLVSVQEVRTKVDKAHAAFQQFRGFSQEQVDAIVESMAAAGRANARRLAEMAVDETGMGNVESKVAKNLLCADLLPRRIRGMKTIGLIRRNEEEKVIEIAEPVGVVAAILPTTNPTSTAIYKSIVSLKSGNAVVHSPHPRAKGCTCATIDLMLQAAVSAGAPPDLIQCINNASMEGTNALMRHPRTSVILSTGGSGIVRAAYSSGKPAFGVGPGNVPVLIDESADIATAVKKVVEGKSFDYGTVCSSEQTIVAPLSIKEKILAELRRHNAFFANDEQAKALTRVLLNEKLIVTAECVGQSPQSIGKIAGFAVPADAPIIVAEIHGVGKQHPLSAEKLSPVLAVYFVKDFAAAVDACEGILKFGGLGHTCVIHATDESRILEYGRRMPAFRVLVNTPSPQGSTGITTNVLPSMTLGCGAMAGNITSDNVGPMHLLNIKRIAYAVRTPAEAFPDSAASAPASVAHGAVVSAVERFLASRGVKTVAAAPPPVARPVAVDSHTVAASVVDRFLNQRSVAPAPAVSSTCGCAAKPVAAKPCGATCACSAKPAEPATAPAPPPPPQKPAEPPVQVTDFVCENDVRDALRQARKIFIGPKTIVTPAARELANQHDILVVARR